MLDKVVGATASITKRMPQKMKTPRGVASEVSSFSLGFGGAGRWTISINTLGSYGKWLATLLNFGKKWSDDLVMA